MKISCYVITYNRPSLLEEAIESFHRQDYQGEKELIILNDHPEQYFVYDHPEVKVINCPVRFDSIGAKRNAAVSLCSGDVIFIWDDDDISLPWRISLSLKYKGEGKYFKNKRAWIWSNGLIKPEPKHNVYHAMGCWDKSYFLEVEGYPLIQSGQDIEIEKKFMKTKFRNVKLLPDNEVYYIYRFGGTGHIHLSSCGYGKGYVEIGKEKVEQKGLIKLNPKWTEEYDEKIKEIIVTKDKGSTIS